MSLSLADDTGDISYFTQCSSDHLKAVNRKRRVIINHETLSRFYALSPARGKPNLGHVKQHLFGILDREESQIDTDLGCCGAGNWAPFPSDILPLRLGHAAFEWIADGVDILQICVEETHRRLHERLVPDPAWRVCQLVARRA